MVQYGFADILKVLPVRKQIPPEVSLEKSIEAKEESIDHKNPGKEQMPPPSHGQPLGAGKSGPTWETPCPFPGKSEHSGGVKDMPSHHCNPFTLTAFGFDRRHCQERTIPIGAIAPIESGMRVENLKAAHDENQDAEGIDPVTKADGKEMAVIPTR